MKIGMVSEVVQMVAPRSEPEALAYPDVTGALCLGPVTLVPEGEGRTFSVGVEEIAVFRGRNGALYAVESRCPHRGAPLAEGVMGAGQVICPYHAYRFDLTTGACQQDASCSIGTYRVREEAGFLLLEGFPRSG